MSKKKIDGEFRKAYRGLMEVVTADRYLISESGEDQLTTTEWLSRDHRDDAIKNEVKDLGRLLKENPKGIAGISQIEFTRIRAFFLDVLDLIGISSEEHAIELPAKEEVWLREAQELLKTDEDELVELAVAKLWLCLRVAEERYRHGAYGAAIASIERLWELIKEQVKKSEELLSLLMLGLNEDKISKLELPIRRKKHHRTSEHQTLDQDERIWTRMAECSPDYAEDLLSLLGRLGLTEGKINIRLTRYSLADVSLEQSLRSTSAWCQLTLSRLAIKERKKTPKASKAKVEDRFETQVVRVENFARYRIAVVQCYLAYSYYRRGRFRRALAQVIPARYTLNRSHWAFSNIFADMIHAGAERRLAGIHNEERINEVKELCEKTIKFFDPKILKGASTYSPKRTDEGYVLSHTFLLRACYELGISCYYLAEIREKDLAEIDGNADVDKQQALKEDMCCYLDEARRYAGIIISHAGGSGAGRDPFWLANGHHLEAFVVMKEPCKSGNDDSQKIDDAFKKAITIIEEAVRYAKESKSKWQLTDILIDHAFILNASARHYDERVREDLTDKKSKLARAALKLLEEALGVATEMAKDEGLDEPRSNFSGQIHLYMTDSYALLGRKPDAQKNYISWLKEADEVEYSRVRDLSVEVEKRVKWIDQSLVIDDEGGLKFADHDKELRRWLIKQAIEKGESDTAAIALLGVSRATFYSWKNELLGKSK